MLACYTDRTSLRAGESFTLHAAASRGPCVLEIARVGQAREIVFTARNLNIADHPVPPNADRDGCDWPVAAFVQTRRDWRTGYYDLALTDATGETSHHFVVLRPPADAPRARAALVLSANTWHAYNWWGGANAYADVTGLMSGMKLPQAMAGAIGVLSARRPFAQNLLAPPADVPRLVNLQARGFEERPWAGDPGKMRAGRYSPYDNSAGFLHKWEHVFTAWAEAQGIEFDFLADHDLEADGQALDGYAAVLLVGHSEYWSGPQRDAIERFVDGGGGLAIFSGNTAFWRVRWEEGGARLVCHKWRGFEAEPDSGANGTHLWSHPAFARPEAAITGLSFLYGGYHRLGLCVARGQGGYTVYDDRHWALEGSDLFYGDVIGGELPLIGYENDGCRIAFDARNLPVAVPSLGVPENLQIIALVPAAFGEEADRGYRPIIPPEQLGVCARIAYGDDGEASQLGMLRGHAVMASFRRGKGEVFNAGTTEWAHGLAAGDPFVNRITLNVLRRFGAL